MDWIVQTMVLEEGQLHVGVPKGGGVDQRFLIEFVVSSRQVVDEVELGGLSDDCEKEGGVGVKGGLGRHGLGERKNFVCAEEGGKVKGW